MSTIGLPWLPTILVDGNYDRLNTLGIGPGDPRGTAGGGRAARHARLRLRDPLSLWLVVALLAAGLDVALTLFGGGRFTLGWYVARC